MYRACSKRLITAIGLSTDHLISRPFQESHRLPVLGAKSAQGIAPPAAHPRKKKTDIIIARASFSSPSPLARQPIYNPTRDAKPAHHLPPEKHTHTHLPRVNPNGAAHNPHGGRELAEQHHAGVGRSRGPLHLDELQGKAVETVPHRSVEETVRQAQVGQSLVQRERVLVLQLQIRFDRITGERWPWSKE